MLIDKDNNFSNFFVFIIGASVVSTVCSQTFLDIFTALIVVGWLYFNLCKQSTESKFGLTFTGIEWAFVAYLIVISAGFVFNASTDAPWSLQLSKFVWLINLYTLIFAFSRCHLKIESILKFFALALLLPTVYSLVSYWYGVDLITGRDNSTRITGLVNSSTYHAHGNAAIFVFLAGLMLFSYRKLSRKWQYFCLLSFSLLGASIFLTLTRGIWLSLALSTLIMAFFLHWKKAVQLLSILAILFGALFIFFSSSRDRVSVPVSQDGSFKERAELFKVNIQMWKEHPLLGIGYGENLRRNREYWDRPEWNKPPEYITSHAHNQFVNVLSTTGILGLIAFMSFFSFFLIKNIKLLMRASSNKASANYILLFACLWAQIEYWLACLTDVTFEYAKLRMLLVVVWALVIALERYSEKITGEKL